MTVLAQVVMPVVSWLAIAPPVILGFGAALVLLVDVQWKPRDRRPLAWVTGVILVASLGFSLLQWDRLPEIVGIDRLPFGAMIVTDAYGVVATALIAVVTGIGLAVGWDLFERLGRRGAEALALVLLSAAGFQLMAISEHLIMMFLGLEIGSIALYVLAGITRERIESDEAAVKYFLLGSVASAVFIYGVALSYAGTGDLNLLGQQNFLSGSIIFRPGVIVIGLALMIVGLAFKVSAAPFHAWAPDVYQGAPAGVVGYMAAVAKIGGFAAMGRLLFFAFADLDGAWGPVVGGIAALSMLLGSIVAIVQDDVRRMLAYSGVAHAGFILTGLVAGSEGATSMWFYLAAYTLQLVGAFGVVALVSGASTAKSKLEAFSGLATRQPWLAAVFATLLLAMGGLPLTSGFVAKFGVFRAAWQGGFEWLVIVGVLASVVAFYVYLRLIVTMFMSDDQPDMEASGGRRVRFALGLVAIVTVAIGIVPGPLLDIAGDVLTR